jgi:hypothetical protein
MFVLTAKVEYQPGEASLDVPRASISLTGSIRLQNAEGQQLIYTEPTTLPMCLDCKAARGKVSGVKKCDTFQVDGAQLLQSPVGDDRTETIPVTTTIYLYGAGGWQNGEWPVMLPCAQDSTQKIPVRTRPFSY